MRIITLSNVKHYFRCNMCGACCKGSVELTPREFEKIRQLGRKLGLRVPIELRDYIYVSKIIMKPIEDSEGEKWCVFLKREDGRALCQIYEDRPAFCRLYPLYMGYSREQDTIYVDVVHCPNMRHNDPRDREEIDQSYVEKCIKEIVERDDTILNIVPSLDRESIVLDLGDRIVTTKLYKKFYLVKEINEKILEMFRESDRKLRDILDIMFRFQSCIKDSTIEASNREISSIDGIRDTVMRGLERFYNNYMFRDPELSHTINLMMSDMGLSIESSLLVVHDMVSFKTRLFKIDYRELLDTYIGELSGIVSEYLCQRFPIFHQIYYLPLEVVYSHGFAPILIVLTIYYMCLRKIHDIDEIAACVDMGGLPYVFKYVSTFVKLTYSSYFQDSWRRVIEV
ncbi:MAG: YkgJ family cysteine cluster protein [Crenarchaeota archaeon]|nr:YkgJ family cysteine cluster protein [Thermoproteota archaeon]